MKRYNLRPIYCNFNRKNKWLGIIDYKSLAIISVYLIICIYLLSLIPLSMDILVYIFVFLSLPVIAIFCVNFNNETIIDMVIIILNFLFNKKIFVDLKYADILLNEVYKK